MILTLKVETIKKFIECIEHARNSNEIADDVYPNCNDSEDFIQIEFGDIGFEDKKKKIHQEADESNIEDVSVRVHYGLCEDIKINWNNEEK